MTVSFDTETWLISAGNYAPKVVCVQDPHRVVHRDNALPMLEAWLDSDEVMVGHNVAFDACCILATWPELRSRIFAKYNRDQVTDTKIRDQLIQIGKGEFRASEHGPVKYTLADCVRRRIGHTLPKEGWRLFYRAFDDTPNVQDWPRVAAAFQARIAAGDLPAWVTESPDAMKELPGLLKATPEDAERYARDDGIWEEKLFEAQEPWREGLHDQYRQARAAFALRLSSCWGIHTDPDRVAKLAEELNLKFESLKTVLTFAGLIREDGTADTKAAMEEMERACAEEGLPVLRTPGGKVSLSAEACNRFDDLDADWEECSLIGQYSWFLTTRKTITNDLVMLEKGCDVPIQPQYDIADTGRTRAAKPAIQAINRGAGIRECFAPREGKVFAQADFEGLELHTLAVWNLEKVGWSKMAEELNAGRDLHLVLAAEMKNIPYEEAQERLAAGDKVIKEARQSAKAVNFGRPGGLGDKKFIRYAKAQYNVDVTLDEAARQKALWLGRFPEMNEFFRLAAVACATESGLGSEEHLFVKRWRGGLRYSALANGRFQGLGADAAKEALWRVTCACYDQPSSVLFGSRIVAFVHDELILEVDDDHLASAKAKELGRLMCEGANKYLHRAPVRVKPLLMRIWSKSAIPLYDAQGNLLPWSEDGENT